MNPVFDHKSAFNGLALCALIVMPPYLGNLPGWLLLTFAGLIAWRYHINQRGGPTPGRALRLVLLLLFIVLVLQQFGTVLGRDGGISLLVLLLGLKFLELRAQLDYVLSTLVYYVLILGTFLYAQSLWLALYLAIAVVACTATLMQVSLQTRTSAIYRFRYAGGLMMQALPLMLLMYFLFPRLQGSLWGLPGHTGIGISGMSDELRLGEFNRLIESEEVAFRVQFEGRPPGPQQLYWRGLVLWHTDGQRWRRDNTRITPTDSVQPLSAPINYQVTLEPSDKRWLFALDLPASHPQGAQRGPGFVFEASRLIRARLRYAMTSFAHYRTTGLSPPERRDALRLPVDASPRAVSLARRWRGQHREPAAVAAAALDFIHQEEFFYTLSPPPLGKDPVDDFLFHTRRGFCEHYAAAFTTLMRAAGIPSRVVVGYQGGEHNPEGDYLIVRQSDAHAWSEIWLQDRGWVRFDPTAAVAPERIEYGIDGVRRLQRQGLLLGQLPAEAVLRALELGWIERARYKLRHSLDAVNMAWYNWVTDFGPKRQRELLAAIGFQGAGWLAKLAGLAGGLILLTAAVASLTLRVRRPDDPVQRLYHRFCRKLAKAGLARAAHEGALAFSQRIGQERPDLGEAVGLITTAYIGLRYGRGGRAPELTRLRSLIRQFRTATAR